MSQQVMSDDGVGEFELHMAPVCIRSTHSMGKPFLGPDPGLSSLTQQRLASCNSWQLGVRVGYLL